MSHSSGQSSYLALIMMGISETLAKQFKSQIKIKNYNSKPGLQPITNLYDVNANRKPVTYIYRSSLPTTVPLAAIHYADTIIVLYMPTTKLGMLDKQPMWEGSWQSGIDIEYANPNAIDDIINFIKDLLQRPQ